MCMYVYVCLYQKNKINFYVDMDVDIPIIHYQTYLSYPPFFSL